MVQIDQPFDNRQPQARPVNTIRLRAAHAVETVEDTRLIFGGDAKPGILNGNSHIVARVFRPDAP